MPRSVIPAAIPTTQKLPKTKGCRFHFMPDSSLLPELLAQVPFARINFFGFVFVLILNSKFVRIERLTKEYCNCEIEAKHS
jgi:hypothetical protein